MRHAIVGAGGVGGLMAAVLAHIGEQVTLILRLQTYRSFPECLQLESTFGNFEVPVERATKLVGWFDVVWLAVKATQLSDALLMIPQSPGSFGAIIPLLNGIDHITQLRELYRDDRVVPATISVEAERVEPGHIVHRSPFVKLAVASAGKAKLKDVIQKLNEFGFTCEFVDDEKVLMWRKLIFLAPFALATSASRMTAGQLRCDDRYREKWFAAVREAAAVANAEGAMVDADAAIKMSEGLPDGMTSSMLKDIQAANTPELDAIAGPILTGGAKHLVPTPAVAQLVAQIRESLKP